MTNETNENPGVDSEGFLETAVPVVDTPSIEAGAPVEPPKKRGRKSNAERERMAAESIESGGAPAPKAAAAKAGAKRAKYAPADIGAMAQQLKGLHQMASMISGIPEMNLQDHEAIMLAGAIVRVSEEYDLSIDGKTGALIQILGTAAMIYVPRLGAITQRAKMHKANKANKAQENAQSNSEHANGLSSH